MGLSLLFLSSGIGIRRWAERRHPGLMAERAQLLKAPGVKSWDKLLAPLMALSLGLPLFVVAGLDHRFEWSPDFPSWLNILGLVLAAAGYARQAKAVESADVVYEAEPEAVVVAGAWLRKRP